MEGRGDFKAFLLSLPLSVDLALSSSFPPQVCELDIIFNFEKAYFILDEFLMGGEVQDTSKKSVLKAIEQADLLQEVEVGPCMRTLHAPWVVGQGRVACLCSLEVGGGETSPLEAAHVACWGVGAGVAT